MKHIYPKYYKDFKCIANLCPDSCCKDWDVELDEKAERFYNTVDTPFGEKIRSLTIDGDDNNRIFINRADKRCPFWNDDMLCDIYINLGEEHLCETCANFPRITQDYAVFTEHMLSFACPVASKLMLKAENPYTDFENCDYDFSNAEFSEEYMEFLLDARTKTIQLLTDRSIPFSERLKSAIRFNDEVQNLIDNDIYRLDEIELSEMPDKEEKSDCRFIFDLHQKLEIISDRWRELIDISAEISDFEVPTEYDPAYEKLALYYVYIYYLQAIDSYNVMLPLQRLVCAYVVISRVEAVLRQDKEFDFERFSRVMQKYSKEVEHSYENSDILEFEFETKLDFWAENLIKIV